MITLKHIVTLLLLIGLANPTCAIAHVSGDRGGSHHHVQSTQGKMISHCDVTCHSERNDRGTTCHLPDATVPQASADTQVRPIALTIEPDPVLPGVATSSLALSGILLLLSPSSPDTPFYARSVLDKTSRLRL